jgi:hypothetical protein
MAYSPSVAHRLRSLLRTAHVASTLAIRLQEGLPQTQEVSIAKPSNRGSSKTLVRLIWYDQEEICGLVLEGREDWGHPVLHPAPRYPISPAT